MQEDSSESSNEEIMELEENEDDASDGVRRTLTKSDWKSELTLIATPFAGV